MKFNNFVIIPLMVEQTGNKMQSATKQYYKRQNSGFLNDLGGNCHFGYDYGLKRYDLATTQHNMQRLMGKKLDLPERSRVLDAGCGFGPVARILTTEFGLDVWGIDLMEERLSEAKERNKEHSLDSIKLSGADYHNLPFPDNFFDGLYTLETLVHAQPLEKVLEEFKRVLKPGGKLVLFEYSIPPLDSLNPVVRSMANMVIDSTGMTSLYRFTHGAFPDILKKAGFENANVVDISPFVWSTWRYLWGNALKNTAIDIITGKFRFRDLRGCTMIYPARKNLGYNLCSANKPRNAVNQ